MNNLNPQDIIWEDYNEVKDDEYAKYYSQDTMIVRVGGYQPHYFVKKDSIGTKEQMKQNLELSYHLIREEIYSLLTNESCSREKVRQAIEKMFILRVTYSQVYFPDLDDLIKNLIPLREKFNGTKQST